MIVLTHRPRLDGRLRARRRRRLPVRGPDSVAASLQRGLSELGLPLELNPKRLSAGSGPVGVLSDVGALRSAIDWKRAAPGRRLVAGPNLVVLPSDAGRLITSPEIDLVLVPSPWVRDLYEHEAPELSGRVAVWPAGVDSNYWAPAAGIKPSPYVGEMPRALLYIKAIAGQRNPSDEYLIQTRAALTRAGFFCEEVEYGSYQAGDFLSALQRADLMVAFSSSESQGLALLEAWSTNVPTYVCATGEAIIDDRKFDTSSAPFLSPETGAEFGTIVQFEELLERFVRTAGEHFRPRSWVLKSMTDSHSAQRYWDLAHGAVAPETTYSPEGLR